MRKIDEYEGEKIFDDLWLYTTLYIKNDDKFYFKIFRSRTIFFLFFDYQSNSKNICEKIHKKILNSTQEKGKRTQKRPKDVP